MSVREHYETLLAPNYVWATGESFAANVARQRDLLRAWSALPARRDVALDLGCGPGFHAVALADLGFARVEAVDLSPTLLAELETQAKGRPIRLHEADLTDFIARVSPGGADLVVCMGDTLTHLRDGAEVQRLLSATAAGLREGGVFVCTYRDLSQVYAGALRIHPVAGDAQRILTCVLLGEEEGVQVTDVLHERDGTAWRTRVSAYRKLRLPFGWLDAELRRSGFRTVEGRAARGLTGVIARL